MPFPIEHATIGCSVWLSCNLWFREKFGIYWIQIFVSIWLWTNFPDIDILMSLVLTGNGAFYHRGFTHSILFLLITTMLALLIKDKFYLIFRIRPLMCGLLLLSHDIADCMMYGKYRELLWPFFRNENCVGYISYESTFKAITMIYNEKIFVIMLYIVICLVLLTLFRSKIKK